MKTLVAALMLGSALVAPQVAFARDIQVSATVVPYRGPGTYMAIYVTKPDGSYATTLWVAGSSSRYYGHMTGWARAITSAGGSINGITGASVGAGQTLTIKASLADSMIDAGYTVVVETAVEGWGNMPKDASVSIDSAGASASGQALIKTLSVKM